MLSIATIRETWEMRTVLLTNPNPGVVAPRTFNSRWRKVEKRPIQNPKKHISL